MNKKPSKNELRKMSIAQYLRTYSPKFKSNLERGFWLDVYFHEAIELHPGTDVEYWTNELFKSHEATQWLSEDDIKKAGEWMEYCKAHNH